MIASLTGQGFDVQTACLMLGVAPSGYNAWRVRPPSARTLRHAWLAGETAQVHKDSGGTAYLEDVQGGGGVTVGVYYAGAKTGPNGQPVGQLNAKEGNGWGLSNPFNVKPQLAGNEEGVREVRFIYANTTKDSDFHLSGLYVDPRMR